jgi:uncharacterized secreted protein with C-terminal beta-propeller domain
MNWYDVFKLLNLLYYQILFYILVKLVFLLHIHRKLLLTSHGEACLLFNSIDQSFGWTKLWHTNFHGFYIECKFASPSLYIFQNRHSKEMPTILYF